MSTPALGYVAGSFLLPDGTPAQTTVTFLPTDTSAVAFDGAVATLVQAPVIASAVNGVVTAELVANVQYTAIRPGVPAVYIYPLATHTPDAPLDLTLASEVNQVAPGELALIQSLYQETLAAAQQAQEAANSAGSGGGGSSLINVPFANVSSLSYSHLLGKIPSVNFVDNMGRPFFTDNTPTTTTVTATFPEPTSGVMVLS